MRAIDMTKSDLELLKGRVQVEGQAPRVTIDVAFLELKNTGAAMKESIGTFRTIIQGSGSSSAVAA